MRVLKKYFIAEDANLLKKKLLTWAQQFEEVVWLDTNAYQFSEIRYDAVLAVDAFTGIKTDCFEAFDKLEEYQQTTADWIFGYLSYDLKNDLEALTSENYDGLHFPELYFFQPKKLFFLTGKTLEIRYLKMVDDEIEADWKTIQTTPIADISTEKKEFNSIRERISKKAYLQKLKTMKEHIRRGDIYEANFCQEFYVENTPLNPLKTYRRLNEISAPPFASFVKLESLYALSASPERYLKKHNSRVISQPIKGTARRSEDLSEDEQLKHNLENDLKERTENVMIVDLVRNDLSRTAKRGSVTVEELCKVYSFKQVHQLISTISSEVSKKLSPIEIIRTTFPMGSMTGAPKISAMQIIEKLEETKRGLYSGCIGYFSPEGNFDFNVVIRTILYNAQKKYISFSVGGAITEKSIPENEYDECLLKAFAMRNALCD